MLDKMINEAVYATGPTEIITRQHPMLTEEYDKDKD